MGTGRRMAQAAVIAALLPAGVAAQAGERLVCKGGVDPVGSLGITGISCDRCQFFTNGKVHRAVFWTEPTILDLDASNPAASVLRKGDVLVAVDGQLITTRDGSARFSALPPDRPTRLRIRRDGQLVDLSVPVAAACPSTKEADAPVVAGRGVPVPPPPPVRVAEPGAPTPPAVVTEKVAPPAPAKVREPVPAGRAVLPPLPPAPARMAPQASLGFGFRCSECVYREGEGDRLGTWTFPEPPEVVGIDPEKDGRAAGLKAGDRLVRLDGIPLTTDEGARRFSDIRPGDALRWTVERDGREMTVTTRAAERAPAARVPRTVVEDPSTAPLRFSGMVGDASVEVRGGRVNVIETEDGRMVIIRTGDAEIRIRVPGGEGR
jgi:hypothetical protein